MDKVTQDRIEKTHPSVRDELRKIIAECDSALTGRAKIRISQGLRTLDEQAKLYAIGRTVKGKKVTNAAAGQSIHNYGLAVDICLIIDGKEASWDIVKDWDNDGVADWYECVKIFAKYGWEWGGSWTSFKDFPHFEKKAPNNQRYSWKTLQAKIKDKAGYPVL